MATEAIAERARVSSTEEWIEVPIRFDLLLDADPPLSAHELFLAWPHEFAALLHEIADHLRDVGDSEFETKLTLDELGLEKASILKALKLIKPKQLRDLIAAMWMVPAIAIPSVWASATSEVLRIRPAPQTKQFESRMSAKRSSGRLYPQETYAVGWAEPVFRPPGTRTPLILLELTLTEVEFEVGSLKSIGKVLLRLAPAISPYALLALGLFVTPMVPSKPIDQWKLRKEIQSRATGAYRKDANCRISGVVELDISNLAKSFMAAADGDRPANICAMQYALYALKHHPGVLDGVYGESTQKAITSFAQSRRLPPEAYLPKNGTPKRMNLSPLFYDQLARALAGEPPPP